MTLPRPVTSALVVVGSVAAVVVLMVVPVRFAGSSPTGPSRPTQGVREASYDDSVRRSWTALECTGVAAGCLVPKTIGRRDERLVHAGSHHQVVARRDPGSWTLQRTVGRAPGRRWVLVGADDATSASRVLVRIGDGEAAQLPADELTLVALPGEDPVRVAVMDYGRTGGREVLHLEEYVSDDQSGS